MLVDTKCKNCEYEKEEILDKEQIKCYKENCPQCGGQLVVSTISQSKYRWRHND